MQTDISAHLPSDFPDLKLIPLTQPKTGFRLFISSWLLHWDGHAILVDPGPSGTIPFLVSELKKLGIQRLTGVLLTHIHIDHAGGIGHLVKALPTGWVMAHPKAHKHLIDPTRLWEGSCKVLGDLPQMYGPIDPVPPELIRFEDTLKVGDKIIRVLETPGHAPHHISFIWSDYIFTGEAVGVGYQLPEALYLRPATPPRFIPEIFLASIERLLAQKDIPEYLCFGHFGAVANARQQIQLGLEQTKLWIEVNQRMLGASLDEVITQLQAEDPRFALYPQLPKDVQERERYFVSNSIKGMQQFYQSVKV